MIEPAFIDSGAFVAFLVGSNPAHEAIRRLFSRPPGRLYTSVFVVAETYDWLREMTAGGAGTFTQLLAALPDLEMLSADFGHNRAVMGKLAAHGEADLSYLGASSLVFMGQHRIGEVWGTDPVLGLEGARLRP